MPHLLLTNNSDTVIKFIISVADSIQKEWERFRFSDEETKINDRKLNKLYKTPLLSLKKRT